MQHNYPSDVIAEQVRKHRARLGITREQLSEECAKVGAAELSYAALTNIESGRRKDGRRRRDVTVEELFALAHALAVPPLALVFPVGTEQETRLPPDWRARHAQSGWRWAAGEAPPGVVGDDGLTYADFTKVGDPAIERVEAWKSASLPAVHFRRLQTAQDRFQRESSRHESSVQAYGEDSEAARSAKADRENALNEFAIAVNDMTNAGMRTPPLYPEVRHELIATGLIAQPEALPAWEPGTAPDSDPQEDSP